MKLRKHDSIFQLTRIWPKLRIPDISARLLAIIRTSPFLITLAALKKHFSEGKGKPIHIPI